MSAATAVTNGLSSIPAVNYDSHKGGAENSAALTAVTDYFSDPGLENFTERRDLKGAVPGNNP